MDLRVRESGSLPDQHQLGAALGEGDVLHFADFEFRLGRSDLAEPQPGRAGDDEVGGLTRARSTLPALAPGGWQAAAADVYSPATAQDEATRPGDTS